jgi:hypothetical protein
MPQSVSSGNDSVDATGSSCNSNPAAQDTPMDLSHGWQRCPAEIQTMIVRNLFVKNRRINGPKEFTAIINREVIPLCSVFPARIVLEAFYASKRITWEKYFICHPRRLSIANMVHLRHLELRTPFRLDYFNKDSWKLLKGISTGKISFSGLRRLDILLDDDNAFHVEEGLKMPDVIASKKPLLFKVNELNVTLKQSVHLGSSKKESNGLPESILGLFNVDQDGMTGTTTTFQRKFKGFSIITHHYTNGPIRTTTRPAEYTTKHQTATFRTT